MEPLKAILVDDELPSLQNLQQKLGEFCPDISVVAMARKPEEAIQLIEHHQPDVIFLDIEMPRMNGFKMLEEIKEKNFDIVFITAYNHYAIDAIRISAFDYLVKPVAIKDLQNSVNRLINNHRHQMPEKIDVLRHNLSNSRTQNDKITIVTNEGVDFYEINQIIRIESSSNYSKIHFKDGKVLLVTKLLKDFEEILTPYRFYRIHNSHLINLSYIKKYLRGDGGQVIMQNDEIIDVARRKKEEFLKLIS
ncbi:MAG TPA: LytTR family DNA-binding domain-containing protein [Hanamia sp.]|nr:LytTR family DNA-binding domain-containing protein [Hanamia sp.]